MSTEPKKTEKTDKLVADKNAVAGTDAAKKAANDSTGVKPEAGTEVTPSDAMKKQDGFKDV